MAKNSMYLYGKNSVMERLCTYPGSIKKIYLQDNFRASDIIDKIKEVKTPVYTVSEKDLIRIKKADRLQGIVAEVNRYQYTPFPELLRRGIEEKLTIVLLDGLNDPHNLGSIMRISACFGRIALVIPEHESCPVNDTVIHVASGGENFVPVSKVNNLSHALLDSKKAGYWVAGTVVEDGQDINTTKLPFPLCLVLGAEGKGIRYGVQKHLDIKVSLPMHGAPLSLNVA
nr:RNA methyltransferase [bacterium]